MWSMALSVLLYQSLQPQLGNELATLYATCFFFVTASFVLLANLLLYKKVDRKRFEDAMVSSDNIDVLQSQLELCLEFGDVEKADKISRKLLVMAEKPVESLVS